MKNNANPPQSTANEAADTLDCAAAAELLQVKIGTLYAWTSQRRVPHFRLSGRCVRFSRARLLEFLAQRNVDVQQ